MRRFNSANSEGSDPHDEDPGKINITRRECVSALGAAAAGIASAVPVITETGASAQAAPLTGTVPLEIWINGAQHTLRVDPRVTLLDLLREHLSLTGSKKGCDHGQCGACTVLAGGRRINSCLSLAVCHDGEEITTVEGLATRGSLHPIQSAFIQNDGFQCGYCTPGQLCSAVAMLAEARRGDASYVTSDLTRISPVQLTDIEIRERMSGNICRCGAYPGIVAAVKSVGTAHLEAAASKETRR